MSTDYFQAIESRLGAGTYDGVRVKRYRITWRDHESLSAGVRDNEMLGVYSPLRTERGVGGAWLLEWEDGNVSRGNLDGSSLANLDELLEAAAQSRQEDPDAAVFLSSAELDPVPLFSEDVAALFDEGPEPLAETVAFLRKHGDELGARNTSAGVNAGRGRRGVWTSEGLRLEDPYTSYSFYSYLDSEVGDGFGSRQLYSLDEVARRLALHDSLYTACRRESAWTKAKETTLILHPHAVESFLDHFVLSNLEGSSIVHGQSRWSAEEFENRVEVVREDLTLRVDPRVPLHYGSYNFSGEGVPARPTSYIEGGRLVEPLLNLKYARKMNREPTTAPRGESLRLELGSEEAWDPFRSGNDGLLVMSVLGMHTQDSVRGDYSLAAPTTLVLEGGELRSKCRTVLSGNFFRDLQSREMRAVRFPHHDLVGLALRTTVYPDKG